MGRAKEIYINQLQSKLSKLWFKNPEEWKQYHVIRDFLKQLPEFKKLSERTIMRYLSRLVETGFLEKKVELSHRTWYKPKPVKFRKAVLKERIDGIDDQKLLQVLDNFSLFFLAEYYEIEKKQKDLPENLKVVKAFEAARKQMTEMYENLKQIDEELEKLKYASKVKVVNQ